MRRGLQGGKALFTGPSVVGLGFGGEGVFGQTKHDTKDERYAAQNSRGGMGNFLLACPGNFTVTSPRSSVVAKRFEESMPTLKLQRMVTPPP